ncbi:NAC domain-containing protein [Hirschfeldia incana]|nr:NAC domain-containing protein [Hirschfeldia incana]
MADPSSNSCFREGKFTAPGFRFHPTDEELVMYYLKRKMYRKRLTVNAIGVVDVYKIEPDDLPGHSVLKTGDRQWFYFTPRSRKYPNAARSGRGTATGYWKATGKDRVIVYNSRSVGLKKTLVFYRGRAPTGERTDWVMHEYTMNEEELDRCKSNAKDYYALYKLFKKSGSGPKNGEEYGAPFQEEEWVDGDESEDGDDIAVPERHEDTPCVDNGRLFEPVNVQLDDFEEILNGFPRAPEVPHRCVNGLASSVPLVNREQELQSTLLNNSSGEFLNHQQTGGFLPNGEPYIRSSSSGVEPFVFQKEDYIEMDDILAPELGAVSVEKPGQFFDPGEFGDFNEFDQLFHDVSMSLDMEPTAQETSGHPSPPSKFADNTSNEKQHFLYQQFQDQQIPENKVNNNNLDDFTDDLWFQDDDDQPVLFDQPQSITSGAFASPSSGVMPGSTNLTANVNGQDQEGENGGGTSPFTSALWAFMDSIPSTPASACEGPINRTFVRMSSFSRISFSGKANGTTSVTSTVVAKKRSRNRGFLLLSIVGALCAIFWVFIATARASGRPVFS